jgi:hypothetical protein
MIIHMPEKIADGDPEQSPELPGRSRNGLGTAYRLLCGRDEEVSCSVETSTILSASLDYLIHYPAESTPISHTPNTNTTRPEWEEAEKRG